MFRLATDSGELKVKFRHIRDDDPRSRAQTDCYIFKDDVIEEVGITFCSLSDNFSRAVGRKIALTRAVKNLPKDLRTKIWHEYFSKTRKV